MIDVLYIPKIIEREQRVHVYHEVEHGIFALPMDTKSDTNT